MTSDCIYRDTLLKDIEENVVFSGQTPNAEIVGANKVISRIKAAPIAEVVPVVRCKDCQFWQRHTQVNRDYGKCERFGTVTTRCNDFCSLGMKKRDE